MTTRILVTDMIKAGSFLYDILLEEPRLKDERSSVTTKNTDFDELEQSLKEGIALMLEKIAVTEKDLLQTQAEEKSIQLALQKRKMELERSEERLATFMNVRPAYMDEYEVLQKELQAFFSIYVERFRNLQWLEAQVEGFHLVEQQKHDEVQRRMRSLQRQFHEEELKFLQGVDMVSLSIGNDQGSDLGDYEQRTAEGDSCFPTSQRAGNVESLGNLKTEIDAMDTVSSDTPSLEQEIDDNDSDNFF